MHLSRRGSLDRLTELASSIEEEAMRLMAMGARAKRLYRDDDIKQAEAAFSQLRLRVKGSESPNAQYIRLFCLCHLALMGGAAFYDQAAAYAQQAQRIKVRGMVRLTLSIPDLPQRPSEGPVATLSLGPQTLPAAYQAKI